MNHVFLTYSHVVRQALGASPSQTVREELVCEMSFPADPLPLRTPKAWCPHAPSNLNEIANIVAQTCLTVIKADFFLRGTLLLPPKESTLGGCEIG